MADVRSLLRSERATRKINHPHALYSATGTLECSVCRIPVKSDPEVWNKHLKSSQHAMRAERIRVNTGTPAAHSADVQGDGKLLQIASRKRKADDDEDENNDSRKKTKPGAEVASQPPESSKVPEREAAIMDLDPVSDASGIEGKVTVPTQETTQPTSKTVDEDEWAAFERDIARPPSPEPPSALKADADISVAPLMAADLDAESGKSTTEQKQDRRAIEEEAEKEDAARALEEEFDEMEGLEARVKRLREKREELRLRRGDEQGRETANMVDMKETNPGLQLSDDNEDEASEEDFDEWGAWRGT